MTTKYDYEQHKWDTAKAEDQEAVVLPCLLILGDMTIQGNITPLRSLAEPLQVSMDNGAQKALLALENKRHLL